MTAKPKKQAKPEAVKFPRKTIPCISGANNDEQGRSYAKVITSSELAAYRVIGMMQPKHLQDEIDAPTMLDTLRDHAAAVNRNDFTHAEAMLIGQAEALQSMFVRLAERGLEQAHMPNLEGFMRLALRAQSQCRATLETLSAIKNPPVVYAKQANFANGPQQVNNGTVASSQAGEKENEQSRLSGSTYELLPDARAPGLASRANQEVETVGEVDRAEVAGRQSKGFAEC